MKIAGFVLSVAFAGTAGIAAAGSESDLAYLAAGEREAARMEKAAKIYEEILQGMNAQPEKIADIRPAAKTAPAPASSADIRRFFDEVRFEIQESIEFPSELKGRGLNAKITVEFQLNPDGTLRTLKAFSSRPTLPAFEVGAASAVRRAAEFFPPVPRRLNTEQVKFKVPIVFEDA